MKIGFIGPGVMGKSMIRNLHKKGFEVSFFSRSIEKTKDLQEEGIVFLSSIKQLAKQSECIITMVGYPADVEEVYFSSDGILKHATSGTIIIDMTTSSPELAERIACVGTKKGLQVLDAPVTGGDVGAKNATLTIFVGGENAALDKALPVLQAMGTTIHYVGKAGSGQHAKLANQLAIAGAIGGVIETLTYATVVNLDLINLIPVWGSGSAGSWQMQSMAPRILKEDLEPGFFIKHFVKDLHLALAEASKKGITLEVARVVLSMYEELMEKGYQDKGTQALMLYYQKKIQEVKKNA